MTYKLALVGRAIVETVRDVGNDGAPSGVIYAALLNMVTYDEYMSLIEELKAANFLRQEGDLLFYVKTESEAPERFQTL